MINLVKKSTSKVYIYPVFEFDKIPSELELFLKEIGPNFKAYEGTFTGEAKKQLLLIGTQGEQIYVLGLGKKTEQVGKIIRHFLHFTKLFGKVAIICNSIPNHIKDAVNGIYLAPYKIGHLKTEEKKPFGITEIDLVSDKDIQTEIDFGRELAASQSKIMQWMDLPANHKTPAQVAGWMADGGKTHGFDVKIHDAAACEKLGLHALLAVGKGSIESPACFVVMHYKPNKSTKKIALIGKGVTFDTGGVSIKPGENMNYMKSDMGGAAAVYGAIEMAAKLKLNIEIIAATPLTENCIDSLAVKPGDVIGSYAGKTIEVINTDAEGRLILADALAYVIDTHNPDTIIDLATLTGNCIAALGYGAAALLSNNDELAESILAAGQQSGEKTWRMPLWDEYKDMMKSDIADIKNLSSAPIAGAITAAKFLQEFTYDHTAWAHLDIAGMAFTDSDYGSMKSASGYGVKLLVEWMENN
jgi:leucyl aminopeptidase